jgi:hypothetical protein
MSAGPSWFVTPMVVSVLEATTRAGLPKNYGDHGELSSQLINIKSASMRKLYGGTAASRLVTNWKRMSPAKKSNVLQAALMLTAEHLPNVTLLAKT